MLLVGRIQMSSLYCTASNDDLPFWAATLIASAPCLICTGLALLRLHRNLTLISAIWWTPNINESELGIAKYHPQLNPPPLDSRHESLASLCCLDASLEISGGLCLEVQCLEAVQRPCWLH